MACKTDKKNRLASAQAVKAMRNGAANDVMAHPHG